jgi:hypothetical protein
MLTRRPCWQCVLSKFLIENQNRPFAYGRWDCCLFVCDAIQVMTGTDIAASFRGRYSSQREARQFGSVRAIAERVAQEHGMPDIPILRANRGDIALVKRGRSHSLGLIDLNGRQILVVSAHGLYRIPLSHADHCWHV